MPTPNELAVDLHDLWFAANACEDMAGAHADAKSGVSGSSPALAFTRPEGIGAGGTNGIYDDWVALRDQIVQVLGTNASSLRDTGQSMRICIDIYGDSDDAVRRAFNERKEAIPYE